MERLIDFIGKEEKINVIVYDIWLKYIFKLVDCIVYMNHLGLHQIQINIINKKPFPHKKNDHLH